MKRFFLNPIFFLLPLLFVFGLRANDTSLQLLGSREGDPASIVEGVSTIHGDYSELEVDLIVSGPDPLVLSRFYSSHDTPASAHFGGWRFFAQMYSLGPYVKGKVKYIAKGTIKCRG